MITKIISRSIIPYFLDFFKCSTTIQAMKALILAGGFATRLWPLCENRAKPLLLLDGKTILAHILEKIPAEMEAILLTNSKFFADFQQELEKLGRTNVEIFCEDAYSDGQKLGALGALSAVSREKNIEETILVLAGDNILPGLEIEQLFCADDEAKIVAREVSSLHEARKFGVLEIKDGRVINFAEKPAKPTSKIVSTGFMAIGKDLLPILHDFAKKSPDALGGIFPELLKRKKKVLAEVVASDWFDIGSFETYLDAHQKLQTTPLKIHKSGLKDSGNAPSLDLKILKSREISKSREIFHKFELNNSKHIPSSNLKKISNKFSGKVFIGENCVIEDCKLHNVIIYPNTTLKNCHISQSVIDENCHLEGLDLNRKLIRAGTKQVF